MGWSRVAASHCIDDRDPRIATDIGIARNHMHMHMHDRLPSMVAGVEADIEARWAGNSGECSGTALIIQEVRAHLIDEIKHR